MYQTLSLMEIVELFDKDTETLSQENNQISILKNKPFYGSDGKKKYIISQFYKHAIIESGWMVLNFAKEEDKKALYNIFYNNGMRVPLKYNKDEALTMYYETPKKSDFIEPPDVIIDNNMIEIKTEKNPHRIFNILDKYFECKQKLSERN